MGTRAGVANRRLTWKRASRHGQETAPPHELIDTLFASTQQRVLSEARQPEIIPSQPRRSGV
jgi:hypothetical protein